jgi:hypothetical protein
MIQGWRISPAICARMLCLNWVTLAQKKLSTGAKACKFKEIKQAHGQLG